MKLKKVLLNLLIYSFFILIFCNASFANSLELESEAAFLMERSTGNTLYEKNAEEKMYPASTTKILTAILAIENCDLNEMATVSKNAVSLVPKGYSNAGLVAGENLSIENLLYALMLNSANEAANVLAEHISGSIDEFCKLMNEKAKEIGCTNSNFVNTNGMHDENHYTTAKDLALIANYCMNNETFRKIVSTTTYELPDTNIIKMQRIMKNTNMLIFENSKYYYEYAIGVKTGFTSQAGNCLVTCSSKDGIEFIGVTLKSGTSTTDSGLRFTDGKSLLEYGYENYVLTTIIEKDTLIDNIEIKNATKETKNLSIVVENDITDFVQKNLEIKQTNVEINNELEAPISKGTVVGKITYTVGEKAYSTNLIAQTDVIYRPPYELIITGIVIIILVIIFFIKKRKKY